ncbi:hypothetical protein EHP00_1025 [Ecytonucleospora hepatopenaei]|uniref:N-acetyltransferase domain-containing protein n=1 Tax=Ecytonucleospora hepatopenaei TaxID=646526 RepID=A0A1W0E505_9MICR|nr:hypothetical protein EHP00_1025 [Ecytonucleospora hepatopenaei]
MKLEIKKVDFENLFEILRIEQKYFNDCGIIGSEIHDRIFENENYFFQCIEKGSNTCIGYVKAELLETDCVQIISIAVEREYRKCGIGNMLLQKILLQNVKSKGCFLYVDVSNKNAINFYIKNGFKIKGVKRNYFKNKSSAFYLTKFKHTEEKGE